MSILCEDKAGLGSKDGVKDVECPIIDYSLLSQNPDRFVVSATTVQISGRVVSCVRLISDFRLDTRKNSSHVTSQL